jgi:hypothetical protein
MQKVDFNELSATELRLELAEAEYTRATTWKGVHLRQDRIAAVTRELIDRGAF